MVNGSPDYTSANAFRRALEDRLKREAKTRGRLLDELRREFLFQRFLALVFSSPDAQWVLKGGAGLLMRLAQARFSKDLDLLRLGRVSAEDAVAELRGLIAPRLGDHLTFVIEDSVTYSRINPVVEIGVTAYIGAKYGSFPIDLALDLHLVASPERLRPKPVVNVPGLAELPEIVLYPLADQVADKVCAMYELYGESRSPSSRYRDLVDLALIVSSCELHADSVCRALHSESTRRGIRLPPKLISPAPGWTAGFNGIARKSKLDMSLDAALEHVGTCLNPLLDGSLTRGSWQPGTGWSPTITGSAPERTIPRTVAPHIPRDREGT